jgi:5-(carboxyamino)imidazole ribonucleotide synthase
MNPPSAIGVLGGGQLGRMLVHAAQQAGLGVHVLEPDAHSPAGAAADHHLVAAYTDAAALDTLARRCAAVTTEFENVPAASLRRLAQAVVVSPPADAVETCQHRGHEKAAFEAAGVPCAPHALIDSEASLAAAAARGPALLPGILKTASMGYDGKGQLAVASAAELASAWQSLQRAPCVLEKRLKLAFELSVIIARGHDGQTVHLPVQQNLHHEGILAVTQVPAPALHGTLADKAIARTRRLADALGYVGVLCVEFFVLDDGTLLANEMAPRPHNSGHHSLDSCDVSQFELQLRTLLRWPLVAPRQHSPAVMLNLLGDLWFADDAAAQAAREPDWPAVRALPGARLHLYGKAEPRWGRKMGHLTVVAATADAALANARQAAALLRLPSAGAF